MILQLNPAIPVTTPKGEALAHFLIDYGMENDLFWVCFIHETGECWTYPNFLIRAQKNITLGRTLAKDGTKKNPDIVWACDICFEDERHHLLTDGRAVCLNCMKAVYESTAR